MKRPTEAAVRALVRKWQRLLALEDVVIDVQFAKDTENGSVASCFARPEYRDAVVRFDLDAIPPEGVEEHVVHELSHYPVWALSKFALQSCEDNPRLARIASDMEEELTTYISRRFLALARAA